MVVLELDLMYLVVGRRVESVLPTFLIKLRTSAQSGAAGKGSRTNMGPTSTQTRIGMGLPWGTAASRENGSDKLRIIYHIS